MLTYLQQILRDLFIWIFHDLFESITIDSQDEIELQPLRRRPPSPSPDSELETEPLPSPIITVTEPRLRKPLSTPPTPTTPTPQSPPPLICDDYEIIDFLEINSVKVE